jgi:hypothetical protein
MQDFLYNSLSFVLPDQLRHLAHTSSLARDIVMRAVKAIPRDDRNYPEHTAFMRALTYSSLTALKYARETSNVIADIHRITKYDTYLLWFACRYDDIDLVKFLLSKGVVIRNKYHKTRTDLFIRSIPKSHRANEIIYRETSNGTSSWRIFAFALEHGLNYIKCTKLVGDDARNSTHQFIDSRIINKVGVDLLMLIDAAIFANNVEMLHAIESINFLFFSDIAPITSYVTPTIFAITNEVAHFLTDESNGIKRIYARKMSSFNQIITEPNHPLFAQHNILVDMRHLYLSQSRESIDISSYAIDPLKIDIILHAAWNMPNPNIARQLIASVEHIICEDNEILFARFSLFAREWRYLLKMRSMDEYKITLAIRHALSKTLIPIRLLLKKYPDLIQSLSSINAVNDIQYDVNRAHMFLNVTCLFEKKISLDRIIMSMIVARNSTEFELARERYEHTQFKSIEFRFIIETMRMMIHYQIPIEPMIPQVAEFFTSHTKTACPHTMFVVGVLLGDIHIMRKSRYVLDLHTYFDRVIARFILHKKYMRTYGTDALAFIKPNEVIKHVIAIANYYCNMTDLFGVIMQNASITDLMKMRKLVRTMVQFRARNRLLIDIIIEALLRKHRRQFVMY